MILRDKVYFEEVSECPADENMAVFEIGCNQTGENMLLVCHRQADVSGLSDWLSDMICENCTTMCQGAQKRFNCCYFGQVFSAIADLNADFMELVTEDTAF